MAVGLLGLSLAASTGVVSAAMVVLAAAALYFCGIPLYGPTIPTMLLLCVPPYQRGTGKLFARSLSTARRVASTKKEHVVPSVREFLERRNMELDSTNKRQERRKRVKQRDDSILPYFLSVSA